MLRITDKAFICKFTKKIVINIIFIAVLFGILYKLYPNFSEDALNEYLSEATQNMRSFFEMAIGIYIAVISILATARTSITEKLSANNQHYDFIISISLGFVYNVLVLVAINILFDACIQIKLFIIVMTIMALYQMLNFFFALLMMFYITVSNASSEAHEEYENTKKIMLSLDDISMTLKKILNK